LVEEVVSNVQHTQFSLPLFARAIGSLFDGYLFLNHFAKFLFHIEKFRRVINTIMGEVEEVITTVSLESINLPGLCFSGFRGAHLLDQVWL
jgi:hypothetical protein